MSFSHTREESVWRTLEGGERARNRLRHHRLPRERRRGLAKARIDLNLLGPLRVLLEEANVTRAGARLDMPQSSASAILARLRAALDDELLVQVGRDFELTPFARRLLPRLQHALPLVEQSLGREEVFDPATSTRSFTVTFSDHAIIEWKPAITAVLDRAPGLRVQFEQLPTWQEHARKNPIRSDFFAVPPELAPEGMVRGALLQDHYVCVIDRSHPGLVEGAISLDGFMSFPHVRTDFGTAHISAVEQRLNALHLFPEYRAAASTVLALPSMVVGTRLIATMPSRLAELVRDRGSTVVAPTPFGEVLLYEQLGWHQSRNQDPGHRWFREALIEAWETQRSRVAEGIR